MNAKAKQRAWSRGLSERDDGEPEDAPAGAASHAPLVAPEGPQVFDVDAAGAGERLDRFLGAAAAARSIALSRTRLKALIEAGEVTVDGSVARDPAMRLRARARGSPSRRRRRRTRLSPARTCPLPSFTRTST